MAAIAAISNVSFGDRSVSFSAVAGAGPDTLAFSVIDAALAAAGSPSTSAIRGYLGATYGTKEAVATALAANGGLISAISAGAAAQVVDIDAPSSLRFSGAGTFCVRIALAHTISA